MSVIIFRYFNSLSNATHPIQIHIAVLEKLRFEKKANKIFSILSKNSAESYPKSTSTRNFKAIKSILLELSCDIENSFLSFFNFFLKN